ncbi:MAG: DUF3291 domain-containing protein [Pseudomonadota bacterium]
MIGDRCVAHVNVATLKYVKDDPRAQPFFDAVPEINALAERSEGFVWRLDDEAEEARAAQVFGEPGLLIALSVWTSVSALQQFVYRSAHGGYLRQRASWFVPRNSANKALWWIEPGVLPTIDEARHRLDWLTRNGPGEVAFDFSTGTLQEKAS